MSERRAAVEVSDLTVAYRDVIACRDVSFTTRQGEFLTIVGASGCGKTTILNTVAGFIKPAAGLVQVDGEPVLRPNARCTVVFQSYALFPWMTVEDNLYFGLRMKGLSRKAASPLIERYLGVMGLKDTNRRYPHELSGGMQQRIALARALVIEPQTILMDEPFAAVDLQTRESLQNELGALRASTSQTIVLVTHSVDEAVYLSDRVIVMGGRPGRILEIYDVPLEHPRHPEMRSAPDFLTVRDEISLRLRTAHTH